jgi:hypothetical protein
MMVNRESRERKGVTVHPLSFLDPIGQIGALFMREMQPTNRPVIIVISLLSYLSASRGHPVGCRLEHLWSSTMIMEIATIKTEDQLYLELASRGRHGKRRSHELIAVQAMSRLESGESMARIRQPREL